MKDKWRKQEGMVEDKCRKPGGKEKDKCRKCEGKVEDKWRKMQAKWRKGGEQIEDKGGQVPPRASNAIMRVRNVISILNNGEAAEIGFHPEAREYSIVSSTKIPPTHLYNQQGRL